MKKGIILVLVFTLVISLASLAIAKDVGKPTDKMIREAAEEITSQKAHQDGFSDVQFNGIFIEKNVPGKQRVWRVPVEGKKERQAKRGKVTCKVTYSVRDIDYKKNELLLKRATLSFEYYFFIYNKKPTLAKLQSTIDIKEEKP